MVFGNYLNEKYGNIFTNNENLNFLIEYTFIIQRKNTVET